LNPGFVRSQTHDSTKGIDLSNEVPFRDATDSRLQDICAIRSTFIVYSRRAQPHPRSGMRRFAARVTAPTTTTIVFLVVHLGFLMVISLCKNVAKIRSRMSSVTTSPVKFVQRRQCLIKIQERHLMRTFRPRASEAAFILVMPLASASCCRAFVNTSSSASSVFLIPEKRSNGFRVDLRGPVPSGR